MKLVTYNRPFPPAFRFFDDFQQAATRNHPPVNIRETEDQFLVEVIAPGRRKDWFTVDVYDDVLEVSYTTEKTGEEKEPQYLRNEFTLPDFSRRFKINGERIDEAAIEAAYVDGVLRLTLPKREPAAKLKRQISVG